MYLFSLERPHGFVWKHPLCVYLGGVSAFNWWEKNCCIFLKKISSPNAFYLFFPLFKHQTTPYNVLFFKKMKKYAFLFSFQTGTGSQWEGPHNNNKATCIQSKFTIHYILLFSTYYTTLFSKFMPKML